MTRDSQKKKPSRDGQTFFLNNNNNNNSGNNPNLERTRDYQLSRVRLSNFFYEKLSAYSEKNELQHA